MIELARTRHPDIEFRVDSVAELTSAGDEFDLIVANCVLMDTPDLDGAMRASARVPRGRRTRRRRVLASLLSTRRAGNASARTITYTWDFPYSETQKRVDPAWGDFTSGFIWFHRPLAAY